MLSASGGFSIYQLVYSDPESASGGQGDDI